MESNKKASDSKKDRSEGHRRETRRPSQVTLEATLFAVSTVATLGVLLGISVFLLHLLPIGMRLVPDLHLPDGIPSGDSTSITGLVTSFVLIYASSRLTRNATLESDRVKSGMLRKAWIVLFEVLWVVLFVLIGESFAVCVDARFDGPICGFVSWAALLAMILARCLLARHDHHSRHVACEALRAIGRSGIICVIWACVCILMLPYGIPQNMWLLVGVILASLAEVTLITKLCLAEGRHKREHNH